jgi:hypothetical protein
LSESKWAGLYDYKGFTIWSPNETGWIAEPEWSEVAIENYKHKEKKNFKTIAQAKKWIREEGVKLQEIDFI